MLHRKVFLDSQQHKYIRHQCGHIEHHSDIGIVVGSCIRKSHLHKAHGNFFHAIRVGSYNFQSPDHSVNLVNMYNCFHSWDPTYVLDTL